jgi:hypothetical protein
MTLLRPSEFVIPKPKYPPREMTGREINQNRELKVPKEGREKWYAEIGRRFMCPANTVRNIISGAVYRAKGR